MNDFLKIESILGIVANENHLRASRDGKAFEELLPAPSWSEEIVKRNGSVNDTVEEMEKIINHYAWQTAKIAPALKGKTLYDTCKNVWDFLYTHIKYREDDEGKEQLRTPSRSFAQRLSRGIDCDDFTIFCGTILKNLNIPFYIRIARYQGKDYFQHVYPVVPISNKQYITIDAVLDEYDAEKTTIETKDFLVMNTNNLNGIDISMLSGIEDEALNEISGILTGIDFKDVNELEGLGTTATEEQELGAIRNYLERTRNIIARNPELIKDVEHAESFLGMVDYALRYWNSNKRDEALGVLEGEENRLNELEDLGNANEGHEEVELLYGLNSLGSYDVLGKVKRQRKFFTKVKQAVKKSGQGIKKVSKAVIRNNPLTASIRGAVLLALKVNLLKVASKLKWGYLTEQEAQANGFDMNEWRKVKTQLAKAEALFVNTLQGKAENFKRAILTGRAGKLSGTDLGLDDDLGVVAAAASTTAAVPFITKILELLKNINYSKLISKVNPQKLKKFLKKGEKDEPTQEGESSMPEGGEVNENPPEPKETETPTQETKPVTTNTETESNANSNSIPENLPAVNTRSTNVVATNESTPSENPVKRFSEWVKANPTYGILIGASAAFLIYQIAKPKRQLSGRGKGKSTTGKAKANPPQIVSGTKSPKKKKGGDGKTFQL